MSELHPGSFAEQEHIVTEQDTAAHWGSGLVPVFSTPALVGWMESTAVLVLHGNLPAGQTSVGGRIDVQHLAATPVGMKVRLRAELVAIDGRKLSFKIQAWDERELIGTADHQRILIDEARFMAKIEQKKHAG